MKLRTPNKIHLIRNGRYLCIRAVNPTPEKTTKFISKVTCKNCLEILEGEKRKC